MGAYEFQGDPTFVLFGDINGDGVIRMADLIALVGCMGSSDPDCCIADLDLDGVVGLSDRLLLAAEMVAFVPLRVVP